MMHKRALGNHFTAPLNRTFQLCLSSNHHTFQCSGSPNTQKTQTVTGEKILRSQYGSAHLPLAVCVPLILSRSVAPSHFELSRSTYSFNTRQPQTLLRLQSPQRIPYAASCPSAALMQLNHQELCPSHP